MNRVTKVALLVVLGLAPVSLGAQLSIPEIAYDAVDPIKLPDDIYLGEAVGVATNSKGNIYLHAHRQPVGDAWHRRTFARAMPRGSSSSIPPASSSARSARELRFVFCAHRRVDKQTTSGWWTKGRT